MTAYLCTLRGTIATAALSEIFSHSFSVISGASQATVAADLAANWLETLTTSGSPPGLRSVFPPPVIYTDATAAEMLAYEPPTPRLAAATHVAITPTAGTGGGIMLPSQCAIAVSITAGTKPNGAPAKGRFYLPGPSGSNVETTTGRLASGTDVFVRDRIADFWSKMRADGHDPALWSRVRGTVVGWDYIRVGRTIDTVRRRRNALPETYSTGVTVP